jgi:hypothetical protein
MRARNVAVLYQSDGNAKTSGETLRSYNDIDIFTSETSKAFASDALLNPTTNQAKRAAIQEPMEL